MKTLRLLLAIFLLPAFANAEAIRIYFASNTNASTLLTNTVWATPTSGNALSSGGVVPIGVPIKITFPASGVVTQNFVQGFYALTNNQLGNSGIVIRSYGDDNSTVYDYTNRMWSGYNKFVTAIVNTNSIEGGVASNVINFASSGSITIETNSAVLNTPHLSATASNAIIAAAGASPAAVVEIMATNNAATATVATNAPSGESFVDRYGRINLSWGTFPTNTAAKARSGGRITGLWLGDSIGMDSYWWTFKAADNIHPERCSVSSLFSTGNTVWYQDVNDGYDSALDVWYAPGTLYRLNSGSAAVWGNTTGGFLPSDSIQFYHLRSATGGVATVAISANGSSWTDVAAVDTSGARAIICTNISFTRGVYALRITASGGPVNYLWPALNDSQSRSPRLGGVSATGYSVNNMVAAGEATIATILTNYQPDFVVFQQTKALSNYSGFSTMATWLATHRPQADVFLISPHWSEPTNGFVGFNDYSEQTWLGRNMARTNGWAYLDILHPSSWADVVTNQFSSDGIHFNSKGQTWTAEQLMRAMDWPALVALASGPGLTNLHLRGSLNLSESDSSSSTMTISNDTFYVKLWDAYGAPSLRLTNAWGTRPGLFLSGSSGNNEVNFNIAGDIAYTALKGTNSIYFISYNLGDGWDGITGQLFPSGSLSIYETPTPVEARTDPGAGFIFGRDLVARRYLYGNLVNATNLPPTTGISGWPANSAGYLKNNGSGVYSYDTPAGGSFQSAVHTNGMSIAAAFSNAVTVYGGITSEVNVTAPSFFGSGANLTDITAGQIGPSGAVTNGQTSVSFGAATVSGNVTAAGVYPLGITNQFSYVNSAGKLVGTNDGVGLTNLTYQFRTNGNNVGTITVGQVLYTNITGNITLGGFSGVVAEFNQWAKVIATNSTATDYKITLPASVTTATNAFVVAQDIWVTNKSKVHLMFDIGPDTNCAAIRFQR